MLVLHYIKIIAWRIVWLFNSVNVYKKLQLEYPLPFACVSSSVRSFRTGQIDEMKFRRHDVDQLFFVEFGARNVARNIHRRRIVIVVVCWSGRTRPCLEDRTNYSREDTDATRCPRSSSKHSKNDKAWTQMRIIPDIIQFAREMIAQSSISLVGMIQ